MHFDEILFLERTMTAEQTFQICQVSRTNQQGDYNRKVKLLKNICHNAITDHLLRSTTGKNQWFSLSKYFKFNQLYLELGTRYQDGLSNLTVWNIFLFLVNVTLSDNGISLYR